MSSLSVLALLSQALVGLAVAYEERVPSPLLVGVHFDTEFVDGVMPLVDTPVALAVTAREGPRWNGTGC